jgi:hypothetical protein
MNENVKQGDTIKFYTCCNADRKLFTGKVEYKNQLGFITVVDGVQYELKKLIDIEVLNASTNTVIDSKLFTYDNVYKLLRDFNFQFAWVEPEEFNKWISQNLK